MVLICVGSRSPIRYSEALKAATAGSQDDSAASISPGIDQKVPEAGNRLARLKLVSAVDLQDAVLFAAGRERRCLGRLRVRLERGAVDRGKKYYFDLERGIVRRKENKETGS
jgi:hypothetical protein